MDRRRAPAWALGFLLLALVVAGCGSAAAPTQALPTPAPPTAAPTSVPTDSPADTPVPVATDTPAPTLPDACSLITPAEGATVVGVKVPAGVPEGDPVTRCVWTAPPTGAVGQLEIDLGDGALKSFQIDRDVLKHAFTAVSAVGDEAWAEDNAIFFRVGETWVALHLVRLNDAASNAEPLKVLATAVAGRL